jgi:hypothetical protein
VEGRRIRMSGGSKRVASSPSLDNTKHNCNSACGKLCASGQVLENDKKVKGYVRIKCKSWSCPVCGRKKAYRLSRGIIDWAVEHDLTRFLTVTLDPHKIPKDIAPEKFMRNTWSKFRVSMSRKLGKGIEYISVMEYHKSGLPHLHILINKFIPQKWISGAWSRLGGGKIAHIKKIRNISEIGVYLSKYLTKSMLTAPHKSRRYTTSRGIKINKKYIHTGQLELFDVDKKSGWDLMDEGIEKYYYALAPDIIREELDEDGSLKYFSSNKEIEDWMI